MEVLFQVEMDLRNLLSLIEKSFLLLQLQELRNMSSSIYSTIEKTTHTLSLKE